MKSNIFLLLLCCSLLSQESISQSYLFSSFPAEKDLSSKQVSCFFQDSQGFMWIGTQNGLNFYDANSIKIFRHEIKNTHSLADDLIQDICEDKDGFIWVATSNAISRFDKRTSRFDNFTTDAEKNEFGFKAHLFSDQGKNIWVAGFGLFKFDHAKNVFHRIQNNYNCPVHGSILANKLTGFFEDSRHHYWVSSFDGLFLYDDNTKNFTRIDIPPADESYKKFGILFFPVKEDNEGGLWVGTWGYGMFQVLAEEKKLRLIRPNEINGSYASQSLNGTNKLWFSSGHLNSVDKQTGKIESILHENDNPFSIREDGISALFTDRQNQLWIGYATQGIQILCPENQLIKTNRIKLPVSRMATVSAIAEHNDKLYLGGWYENALCCLNRNNEVIRQWRFLPENFTNESSNISDIWFDHNSNIWVTTFNGLVCINEQTNKTSTYRIDSSITRNNRFIDMLVEGDSVIWLSGYDNGLTRFSIGTKRMELFGHEFKPLLWKITFDQKQNIWCANNAGNLLKFDPLQRKFTEYKFDSLTEHTIYNDIQFDAADNSLWVSTGNGLLQVNAGNLQAKLFTEKNGLPSTQINLLEFDKQHQLWIGTNKGLSVYNIKNASFRNFYTNNGLVTDRLEYSLHVNDREELLIGGDNYYMSMNTKDVISNRSGSPVQITAVYEADSLLNRNNKKEISLPYNLNDLGFEFAIGDYINSEDNVLLYRLEGWDKEFIRTKTGKISYNKLPPGTYTFRVKGIDHNGSLNKATDEITIIIRPPYRQTWWFIALVSLFSLALLIFVIRYISQRNLKEKLLRLEKEQAVDKERNRISKDMHDDLGSGLTKIAIMSEVVKKQMNEPEKAKQQLDNISASSRELVDNLQDIIWVLNPKNDTLENLAAYIREYALKFFEPFETIVQFNYPAKFSEQKLSEETRRNIFLTIKESFNNIAKHAHCNKVTISIEEHPTKIIISDNGKGFNMDSTRRFGNGLQNMKNRMEQVGGTYSIASMPGKGTTITMQVLI